ncbi:MAG: hypothetical protein K940chlam2_01281 [Chlamydiae bacterium]|nr:hypothetical protein [Chlamydiota bacterium]
MSERTKTHPTKRFRNRPPQQTKEAKKSIPWREVAKENIEEFTEVGLAVRGARLKAEITQRELADAIGVKAHHISEMEHGKRSIGKEMAKRLAKFFKVDYRLFL